MAAHAGRSRPRRFFDSAVAIVVRSSNEPAMTVRTTDDVPERDRVAYWREVISATFVRLRPERIAPGVFSGSIRRSLLGHLRIGDVRSGPQRVLRTSSEIAASTD